MSLVCAVLVCTVVQSWSYLDFDLGSPVHVCGLTCVSVVDHALALLNIQNVVQLHLGSLQCL